MSNWQNDNWNGNDGSNYPYPVEVLPRPLRRLIRFSFRFYVLAAFVVVFLWATYAGIQTVRHLSANQPAHSSKHSDQPHTKGHRP